jgi:DNA-directed RNA polymerase subunit RPC12/RpoP
MKVKKFVCASCGAPKINAYQSPYIVCDFCGSFVDVDLTVSMKAWYDDPKRVDTYNHKKAKIEAQFVELHRAKKKDEYFKLQWEYWDMYYRTYPEYLPPTIHFDDVFYKDYIDICADSSTEAIFSKKFQDVVKAQFNYQAELEYYTEDNVTRVRGEGFFKMVHFHVKEQEASLKEFYANPKYALVEKLLPYEAHLKMKLSTLVQGWMPYLTDNDAQHLMKITGFAHEYIDAPEAKGKHINCEHCEKEMFAPENAWKVYCESCHRMNAISKTFQCSGCGVENVIPTFPTGALSCSACGTENRVLVPLFG